MRGVPKCRSVGRVYAYGCVLDVRVLHLHVTTKHILSAQCERNKCVFLHSNAYASVHTHTRKACFQLSNFECVQTLHGTMRHHTHVPHMPGGVCECHKIYASTPPLIGGPLLAARTRMRVNHDQ